VAAGVAKLTQTKKKDPRKEKPAVSQGRFAQHHTTFIPFPLHLLTSRLIGGRPEMRFTLRWQGLPE
jgi:hypothetical protein